MLNQTQKTFSTLIAGEGVFEYEPKVSYLFGFPKSISEILPQLNHTTGTINAITNALNAGKEVTVHQNQITLQGYSGTGYRIFDPVTGSSADMISGGLNGGNSVIEIALNALSIAYSAAAGALDGFYKSKTVKGALVYLKKLVPVLSLLAGILSAAKSQNIIIVAAVYITTSLIISLLVSTGAPAIVTAIAIAGISAVISEIGFAFSQLISVSFKRRKSYYV